MSNQLSISSLSVPDWVHSKTTKRVVGATAVALLLLWWWRRREFEKKHPPIVLRGTRASATGKVLITGGYLVLEREHTGLVLSVSARFHSTVFPITPHLVHQLQQHTNIALPSIEPQAASQPQQHTYTTHALVYAPQRNQDVTYYTLHYTSGGHFRSERKQGEPNPFVEYTLEITLSLIMTLVPEEEVVDKLKNGILLYLKGDGAFYTSEKETKDQENGIFSKPLPPDSKTGLGSSAALVSSLVAALFAHFGINPCINPSSTSHTYQALTNTTDTHDTQVQLRSSLTLKDQDLVHIAHATAQLCHCVAQGKTGSGFDISAAFYGSQQYKRFTPQHIQPLIARMEAKQHIPAGLLLRYLLPFTTLREVSFASPTKQEALIWDQAVTPLTLPPGLVLVLGDVHGGSKTPDMVKQVLTWRESHNSESERIWTALGHANQQIEQGLRELTNAAEKDKALYDDILQKCAKLQVNEWSSLASPIATKLQSLRSHFQHIRELLVAMGRDAGVEIEPKEQTHLLNQMGDIPGVLFAGVPGAGGSDAIFTIVLSPTVIPLVERVWKSSRLVIHRLHVDADTQPGVVVDRTFQMEGHRWSLFYGNK